MQFQEALTFDDVLLKPAASAVLPNQTDVRTRLTRTIELGIPLMSAAMDTVTEAAMAIAMAQVGGIGVIHKNLTAEAQANEVRKVKKFESGMVVNPDTIHPEQTLADALALAICQLWRGGSQARLLSAAAMFGAVESVIDAGHDPRRFATDLLERFRDLLVLQAVPDAITRGVVDAPEDVLDRMREQAARMGPATLTRYAEVVHAGDLVVTLRWPRSGPRRMTARFLKILPSPFEARRARTSG